MSGREQMTLEHFDLFTDEELKAIAKGGHCMVEAWLHVRQGDSTVSNWHKSLAKAQLTKRQQERELQSKLDQVALEALGAYDSGEDYDSLDESEEYPEIEAFDI